MAFPLQLLVVDDDEGQCRTLTDILNLQGFHVDTALSGAEAFALFEKQSYELAIVDIRLGDISGPDLVKKISDCYPATEFIYITGFATLDTAMMAVRQKRVVLYEERPVQVERILGLCSQIERKKQAGLWPEIFPPGNIDEF